MKFKRQQKSAEQLEDMTAPISGSLINWFDVTKMKFTTYFNEDKKIKAEINIYFNKEQSDWQYQEQIKLRQNLSKSLHDIRRIPDVNQHSRNIPMFQEWYGLARENAKHFARECDTFHGHCKPGINQMNRKSQTQHKFFCVPLLFLSYGQIGKDQVCFAQFGHPHLNSDDEFKFDTYQMIYDLDKYTPKSNESFGYQWGAMHNFDKTQWETFA